MECFDEISKVWWEEKGVLKILHEMNDLRLPWIQNRLRENGAIESNVNKSAPFKGLSILDVGCGGGILTEPMGQLGASMTGLDPNVKLIDIAKSRAKKLPNLEYFCTTIEEHAVNNEAKYDVLVCSETVEHVAEQEIFVKYCVKCVKPGGSIFMTTNSKSWSSKFVFITLLEDILRYFPQGTHSYDMFIDIDDLSNFLKNENCETTFKAGMIYDPFRSKWILVKNTSLLNYVLHAVKMC